MIDFHKLSNYEINNAVHNALLPEPFKLRFEGKGVICWIDGEREILFKNIVQYGKNTLKNYCGKPEDAWRIIESIWWDLLFSDELGVTTWGANMRDDKYFTDKLRAAMIVFLKKQKHIEYEGIYCEND